MAIRAGKLNKTVVIERKTTTLDASGDTVGARTEIEAALKIRLTRNKLFGQSVGGAAGPISASTHKGLTDGGHGGQIGDMLIDGSDEYTITFIDKKPGGQITGDRIFHWEIFLNHTSAERA